MSTSPQSKDKISYETRKSSILVSAPGLRRETSLYTAKNRKYGVSGI